MNLPAFTSNAVLLFVAGLLVVCIVTLIVAYLNLSRRLKKAEAERDVLKKTGSAGAEAVLEDARKQAMIIVQRAQEKAQAILSETKQFQLDAKRILETEMKDVASTQSAEIQKASNELIKNYELSLSKVKEDDINMFKTMTQSIQKDMEKEMLEFKTTLEKETVSSKQSIEKKLQDQYTQVGTEIEEYKKQQIQKVDSHILALIEKATLLAIAKSLSLQDHQDLVLEALQEAKKEIAV